MTAPKTGASEVTTGAAARYLNISQDTVSRLCEQRLLRARRVGIRGWWRIRHASLIEYRNRINNS